jgi:phage tail sheath protein FI
VPESELPGIRIRAVSAPAPIEGVDMSVAAFAGHTAQHVLEAAVRVESLRDFEEAFGGLRPDEELGYAVQQFFANGGRTAWVAAAPAGTPLPEILTRLDAAGPLGLLCLPGETDAGVWREALGYAARRGAFALVDPPGVDPERALALARTLAGEPGGEGAAIFFPPVRIADPPAGGTLRTSAPSGAVAGLYARNDRERGVWSAPAGTYGQLPGVAEPAVELSSNDASALAAAGVNPLRRLEGAGVVVWGARTLAGAGAVPEWRHVNVRRFGLFLEQSLSRGLEWAVFEPNGEPLWSRVRRLCSGFLQSLHRAGAFAGETADDSYFVRCGADTMTREDIEHGRMRVVVGVAPLRPAEFVVFDIAKNLAPAPSL